jgi:hypothetical protein
LGVIRAVRRSSRWLLGGGAGLVVAAAILLIAPPTEPVEINVSPLATTTISGQVGNVLPGADMQRCLPEVMLDGTLDTLYLTEIPAAADGPTVTIRWPWPVDLRRIGILGGDDKFVGTLVVEVGPERLILRRDPNGVARPIFEHRAIRVRVDTIVIHWLDRPPGLTSLTLNAVAAMAVMPRWQAWCYVLVLNVIGPWIVGAVVVAGVLGIGRRLAPDGDLGRRLILGLLGSTALAVAWIVAPRGWWEDAIYLGIMGSGAVWELFRGGFRRSAPDRRLTALIAASAGLLILDVFVDTCVVMSRRMQPVDYLNSHMGGELFAARAPLVGQLLLRPWLLHAFFAPLTEPLERFSYWGYVGVMAWLNALVLVPIALIARRWGRGDGLAVAGWVALLPILGCYNACGQRPLAAACCLLAIAAWQERRSLWGGLALTTAIGVHPGSLFLIPPAAVVILWRQGFGAMLRSLVLPVVAYMAWSAGIRSAYPEASYNMLVFYPLMTNFDITFPPGSTLLSAALSLPADRWAELLSNRINHLRHYIWTDNWSEPVVDVFRWVSLISTLGVVWTVSLVRPSVWRGRGEFVLFAVAGPLVIIHLHIGMANPQFHISPTPFFSLALLAIAAGTMPTWALRLGGVELFVRRLLPLAIVLMLPGKRGEPGLSGFGLLGDDRLSCIVMACLPPLAWLGLAQWVRRLQDTSAKP